MKQILLINDVVGYGKVGMGAMLPILSYLGIPTYSLPTALVSNTLDYGKFNIQDTTDYIRGTLPVWKELGFGFDAVCTGLMFSEEQARLVAGYCREQGAQGTTVFVDPILLIFPNYTEACYLTDTPIKMEGISWMEAEQLLDKLRELGCKSVLITSCKIEGQNAVVGYNHYDDTYFHLEYHEIPGLFHGTGDIFSAVLIGHLLNGENLRKSTRTAMDTVFRMIDRYRDTPDRNKGIPVEKCLDLL